MGEDRRPNVGGRHGDVADGPQQGAWSDKQLELEAKRLRKRTRVDGHEQKPEPGETQGDSA